MWFVRPLWLIKFRKPAIIAVITLSVHHTFALPANTGHSSNVVSMLPTIFDAGPTFEQHGENAPCLLGLPSGPEDQRYLTKGAWQ